MTASIPPAAPGHPGHEAPDKATATHPPEAGKRSAAGSNYGDYVPPAGHVSLPGDGAVGDAFIGGGHGVPELPAAEIAPDDPAYEDWRAAQAQRATRERQSRADAAPPAPDDLSSNVGEEDPGAADDTTLV